MHLIAPLVSGIRGAENGSVAIYDRGTTNFATVYPDFEASTSSVPTAPLTLDANGGRTVFVGNMVDVVVYDTGGVTVIRSFGAGVSAADVEVISNSFIGTAYVGAPTAAGMPTTLLAVLNKWLSSAGAVDWKVSIAGVATNLQAAFSTLAGIFFNVKAYGALGDNVTDDTAFLQAAATAATVAGGVLFFPAGHYRTTDKITVGPNVSIMGAGAKAAAILIDHASRNAIEISAASVTNPWQYIRDITIAPKQANSGKMVHVTSDTKLLVEGCTIGSLTLSDGIGINVATTVTADLAVVACRFELHGNLASAVKTNNGQGNFGMTFIAASTCKIAAVAYDGTFFDTYYGVLAGVDCDFSSMASGAATAWNITKATTQRPCGAVGVSVSNPGGGAVNGFTGTSIDQFNDVACVFGSNVFAYTLSATYGPPYNADGQLRLGSRDARRRRVASDAANLTLREDAYGHVTVVRSTNTNQTLAFSGSGLFPPLGSELVLTYKNGSGGNIAAVTVGAKGLATFALNAGLASTFVFKYEDVDGTIADWVLIGSQTGFTP